eukprot:39690-Eustigmatos_ZCMA.PRE.1
MKTLSAGLQLAKPNVQLEDMGSLAVMEDPNLIAELVDLQEDWCTKVEAYLHDGERNKWETNESGPDTEIEYWKRRLQRL